MTAVVVALPIIARDFGLDASEFAWIMDAYSLEFTITLLIAGALADKLERRRALLWGNAIFLIASIACGLAEIGFVW